MCLSIACDARDLLCISLRYSIYMGKPIDRRLLFFNTKKEVRTRTQKRVLQITQYRGNGKVLKTQFELRGRFTMRAAAAQRRKAKPAPTVPQAAGAAQETALMRVPVKGETIFLLVGDTRSMLVARKALCERSLKGAILTSEERSQALSWKQQSVSFEELLKQVEKLPLGRFEVKLVGDPFEANDKTFFPFELAGQEYCLCSQWFEVPTSPITPGEVTVEDKTH